MKDKWQEIAREAVERIARLETRYPVSFKIEALAIIRETIERSHAAQPKSDDHQRLELAREAVVDWRAQKLSDYAAMFAVSLAIMPQPKPTEAGVARAKSIISAQPQSSEWEDKCRKFGVPGIHYKSDQPPSSAKTTD